MKLNISIHNFRSSISGAITFAICCLVSGMAFAQTATHSRFLPGSFSSPIGITRNINNGDLLISEFAGNRIKRFNSSGTFLSQFGTPGNGINQFNKPWGLASDGLYVYVADSANNRIQKYTFSGGFVREWGSPGTGIGQFANPTGVAIDSASDTAFVVDKDNDRIQVFSVTGVYQFEFGSTGTTSERLNEPVAVALNQNSGQVYVADRGNNRIVRLSLLGGGQLAWGTLGTGNGQFTDLRGITVDSAGKVYVSDEGDRIQRFSADGVFEFAFGGTGSGPGQLDGPYGMAAYNEGGNQFLAVAEFTNDRVQIFKITERDRIIPTVTVFGKTTVTVQTPSYKLRGKAADSSGSVSRVEVKVGSAPYRRATGTTTWNFTASRLQKGRNLVSIRSVDAAGNFSKVRKITVVRK